MTELQEMQQEIAQLKAETLALKAKGKSQSTRQRFVFALAVAGMGLALMTHNGNTAGSQMQSLSVRELKVVDNDNNVVLFLSPNRDGEGQISVYNGSARKIVTISATVDTGEGGIWIADEEGTSTACLRSQGHQGILWTKK